MKSTDLCKYIYSVLEDGVKMCKKIKINDEKAKRDYGATAEHLAANQGD